MVNNKLTKKQNFVKQHYNSMVKFLKVHLLSKCNKKSSANYFLYHYHMNVNLFIKPIKELYKRRNLISRVCNKEGMNK